MSEKSWHKGYKEVKNVIHNDMGVTKEEVLEVFRQVAKDEIQKQVFENKAFIHQCIKDVIRQEMMQAIEDHRYPQVTRNVFHYGKNGGENNFKDYVSGVMKEAIVNELREQFEVNLNIHKKE